MCTQGECRVMMEAEIKVVLVQAKGAKECQQPPEAKGEAWNRSSLTASEGTHPADTSPSDCRPPEL